ncbi:type II secretion system protein [Candidatus Nomurabacteria bacterium]|nr:type II secretion system protein [Candidatus Saccharibacteria bacterium]MCB9822192.1 type II secretion system protein [Candidatus Nomurabacteria bacterium]
MKQLNNKKGFTLIEVVLVLAIGGLIFLLAFIAFQQVSANRRDTQRRADAGRIVAELQNYYGDNRSYPVADADGDACTVDTATPKGFRTFIKNYLCSGTNKTQFLSPDGNTNYATIHFGQLLFNGYKLKKNEITFFPGYNCDLQATAAGGAVLIGLEKGEVCRAIK